MTLSLVVALTWAMLPGAPEAASDELLTTRPAARNPDRPTGPVKLGSWFGGFKKDNVLGHPDRVLNRIATKLASAQTLEPVVAIKLLLASSNLRLGRAAEPAASRYLLELPNEESGRRWRQIATSALGDLRRAREILDALPAPAAEAEEDEYDKFAEHLEILEAFAHMFLALAAPVDDQAGAIPADSGALTEALSGMATYLEAEDKELANSATLWQAAALRRLHRPDRAVELLSLPLSQPGTSPLELFTRLERIKALADQGDLEAAMVLALRIEEACSRWYQDEEKQAEARRACLWLRLRLYERYTKAAKGNRPIDQAGGWAKLTEQIRKTLWEEARPAAVARLGWTMPLLVDPQEALEAADRSGEEPMSQVVEPPADSEEPTTEPAPAEPPAHHH